MPPRRQQRVKLKVRIHWHDMHQHMAQEVDRRGPRLGLRRCSQQQHVLIARLPRERYQRDIPHRRQRKLQNVQHPMLAEKSRGARFRS